MNLENWMKAVALHRDQVDSILEDRKTLKNSIKEFLKSVFDFDEIEFSTDFTKITLLWDYPRNPSFTQEKINDFPFDWEVKNTYEGGDIAIDVYPWGLKNSQ